MTALMTIHLALALAAAPAGAPAGAAPKAGILGTWKGTSICVKSPDFPNCHDEVLIYDVSDLPDKPLAVDMKADKIVNGERGLMGEFELTYDPEEAAWTHEIDTPRVHALWSFKPDGAKLTGTLVDLPSRKLVRNVSATKEPSPPAAGPKNAHDSGS